MKKMFSPKSVAVFGVSESSSNLARIIVENLIRFEFRGNVYLIGREGYLHGRKIFPSIEAIGVVPDLAVLLIRADQIPYTLDACGRLGTRDAIVEAGGFSEFSNQRRGLETEILRIAEKWRIRLVGPNCIGIIDLDSSLVVPFFPLYRKEIKKGPVSVISQSGGVIHNIIRRCEIENVGLTKMIGIGNKLILGENAFLEFLLSDPGTAVVGLYLESFGNGRDLMDLAEFSDKPVVVLKANRTEASRKIARFHTTALAGDDRVADAAFKQCGAHRVESLGEMIDLFKIFSLPLLKGPNLAVLSRSGGLAVLLADAAFRYGFRLAKLPKDFFQFVKQGGRSGVIRTTNPFDLGDIFDTAFCAQVVQRLLERGEVDGIVFFHEYDSDSENAPTRKLIRAILDTVRAYQKPVVLGLIPTREDLLSMKELCDLPIFSEIDAALKALSRSLAHYNRISRRKVRKGRGSGRSEGASVRPSRASHILSPEETFSFLASEGFALADYAFVADINRACEAARRIGYPVALKTASSRILHKTERKGVELNLKNDKELKEAFVRVQAEVYIVQKMVASVHETFVGGKNDPEFGPILLFGSGGTLVELFEDIAMRIAPVDQEAAEEMIRETKAAALLHGYRGRPPADIGALTRFLSSISRLLIAHHEIISLDINPLIVREKDRGCLIIDAKILHG